MQQPIPNIPCNRKHHSSTFSCGTPICHDVVSLSDYSHSWSSFLAELSKMEILTQDFTFQSINQSIYVSFHLSIYLSIYLLSFFLKDSVTEREAIFCFFPLVFKYLINFLFLIHLVQPSYRNC